MGGAITRLCAAGCGRKINKNGKFCSTCGRTYHAWKCRYPNLSYDDLIKRTKESVIAFRNKIKKRLNDKRLEK